MLLVAAFGLAGCLQRQLREPVEDVHVQACVVADRAEDGEYGELHPDLQWELDETCYQLSVVDAILDKQPPPERPEDEAGEESSE